MKKCLLMVALTISSALCMGAKYTLVTNSSDLADGDIIVIGCTNKNIVASALDGTKLTAVSATFGTDYVTTTDALELTLKVSLLGNWNITCADGKIGCTSNKNSLTTNTGADKYSGEWVVESINSGDIKFLCKSNAYKNTYLQYNSSAKYFSNYDSKQTAIQFYKKLVTSDPVIECVDEINYGLVLVHDGLGESDENLAIDAQNLTEAISVSITAGGDHFTVDKTSVPATGGNVKVSFSATTGGDYSGTLKLQSGTASVTVALKAQALVVHGTGEKNEPLTCGDVIAMAFDDASAKGWVSGYILGSATTGPAVAGTAGNTSLILADDAAGTNKIAVALPEGDVRTALNVADHPGNVGLRVKVYGALQKYFGGPGMKQTSAYEWIDVPTGVDAVAAETAAPQKILRNGQVMILRNGHIYTVTGAVVK